MALKATKIERLEQEWIEESNKPWKMSKSRKKLKKERNRKLRRINKFDKPKMNRYDGWEY